MFCKSLKTKSAAAAMFILSQESLFCPSASLDPVIFLQDEQSNYVSSRHNSEHSYADFPHSFKRQSDQRDSVKVLNNVGFTSGYSEILNQPLWTCYRLTRKGEVGFNAISNDLSKSSFKIDSRTTAKISSSFFTRSGYDRGHMAPVDSIYNEYGTEAQKETYFMSNICPQLAAFNRGIWKSVEAREANIWANAYQEIWIIAGPIIDESDKEIENKGKNVPVPSKFYKIFIDEKDEQIRMLAIILPHQKILPHDLVQFVTTVRDIELETGLDFNSALPDLIEHTLENSRPDSLWFEDLNRE